MVRRRFKPVGSWAIACGLIGFASALSLLAQARVAGQRAILGVECSQVADLQIDKQTNLRAAMIMVGCGLAEPGRPGQEPQTAPRLGAGGSAPNNQDVITGTETYPKVTQSESMVWSSDGRTIVVNYNDSSASPSNYSGVSVSTDGGATFKRLLPAPFAIGHGTNFGDPIVVFNAALGMWFAGDLVSGCGGFGIGLWTSPDGLSWSPGACAHSGVNDDRESMWVDNSPDSSFYGRMYISWNDFNTPGDNLFVTHSDNGIDWSAPVQVSSNPPPLFRIRNVQLTGSPSDGTVFAAAMDEGGGGGNMRTNLMYRSSDGGSTWTAITMGPSFAPPGRFESACGTYFYAIAPIWRHMGWGQPGVGPNGVVHYAYAAKGANPDDLGDIYYTRSLDSGDTWSDPIILNSDWSGGSAREQWMPSLSVTVNGEVQVSWYDRRDTIDRSYEVWGIHSHDNGETWLADAPISDVVIPQPEQPDPNVALCYAGDYNYVTAFGDKNYVTWTDGRIPVSGHFQQDVFFAPSPQTDFVFTDNNPRGPNSVSAYRVGPDGSLSPVHGSPFFTGGVGSGGGLFASTRAVTAAVGRFLYIANDGSDDISGFTIDSGSGVLNPVPGSPFDTGGAAGSGISLAITPDNRFLYATNGLSQDITSFTVNPDGSLAKNGDRIFAFQQASSARVTPDGRFLAVVLPTEGPHGSVVMFGIGLDGTLTLAQLPQLVRPFGGPDGVATGIDITCDSTTVTVSEARSGSTLVNVFSLDPDSGKLTAVDGSPFNPPAGINSNVPLLSVDDAFLFVSNQASNSITALRVGPFSLIGAFSAGGTPDQTPVGLAINQAGSHLYVAKGFNGFVSAFNIGPGGTLALAPGSPVSTGQPGGLQSLSAFPTKSCSSSTAFQRAIFRTIAGG
jgi:hypothetical protein